MAPIIFPIVASRTLYTYWPILTYPFARATPIILILATLCSNPQTMKTKIHQKIMISFPDSVFILVAHHTARQTRILQRMALASRGIGAYPTLPAAMLPKYAAVSPLGIPVIWKMATQITDPTRFPIQQTTHSFMVSAQLTAFLNAAEDITKLFPVNSSAPAMTTRLRADAKAKACTGFVQETASPALITAPRVKATKLPKEINMPATIRSEE